jgi:glucose-6-phosphate isomerase, archaeal
LTAFLALPVPPMTIRFDPQTALADPSGPVLTRRMSDLKDLFADTEAWDRLQSGDDPVVYTVASSPVPELPRELPQSVTTIQPGDCGGELFMTKGHQHPDPQGEIYLGLAGAGGLALFDGEASAWIDMAPGTIGYIPPGWAHRSVNVGTEPYRFLAVYPGSAGHDYQWVVDHGMGRRAWRSADGFELRLYGAAS